MKVESKVTSTGMFSASSKAEIVVTCKPSSKTTQSIQPIIMVSSALQIEIDPQSDGSPPPPPPPPPPSVQGSSKLPNRTVSPSGVTIRISSISVTGSSSGGSGTSAMG